MSSIIIECSERGRVGVSGLLSGEMMAGAGVRVRRLISTEGLLAGVGVGFGGSAGGGAGLRDGVLQAVGGGER